MTLRLVLSALMGVIFCQPANAASTQQAGGGFGPALVQDVSEFAGFVLLRSTDGLLTIWNRATSVETIVFDDVPSLPVSLSSNGRYVAFATDQKISPADTNRYEDVYVFDRETRKHILAGVNNAGESIDPFTLFPSISGDGRFVAFQASNFPRNGNKIFIRDLKNHTTEKIPVDGAHPLISGDGRFVIFFRWSADWSVYDRQLKRILGLPVIFQGSRIQGSPSAISYDGRYVLFNGQIGSGPPRGYVLDRQTKATTLVSSADRSFASSISADGRFITFSTLTSSAVTVFLHDRRSGSTEKIAGPFSPSSTGFAKSFVSDNGRFVAFSTRANFVVPGDGDDDWDAFLRDRQ